MNMGWPEWIMVGLLATQIIIYSVDHGKPRGNYNAATGTFGAIFEFILLWWGGFFD